MNSSQVITGRKVLMPFSDRVKLRMVTAGDTTTMTPYLISSPETEGVPVVVVRDMTPVSEISSKLMASCRDLVA